MKQDSDPRIDAMKKEIAAKDSLLKEQAKMLEKFKKEKEEDANKITELS